MQRELAQTELLPVVGGGVVHRLMKKLGVSDVAALVKFAVKHGITSID